MSRLATTVALTGAALLALAGPAQADAEPPPVGVVVQHDDGTQSRAIRVSGLYPTAERQVVFFLSGEAPVDVRRMRWAVENLADRENECGRPEVRAADTTCDGGPAQGELSAYLEVTLTAGRVDGDACDAVGAPVSSTLRALSTAPAVVGLPDGEGVLCVVADLRHTEGVGDDVTQSDSTGFDLRMDFDARPVPAAAPSEGTVTIRPAAIERGMTVNLGPAAPGVSVGVPLLAAGLLLGCGAAMLLAARRRGLVS